jgi:GNAT superfamily N-acetyltransferase
MPPRRVTLSVEPGRRRFTVADILKTAMTAPVPLHFRFATAGDIPALASVINAAFVVESFLHGTRTSPEHLEAQMQKGRILIAEDDAHAILASMYMEPRGASAYLGMLAVEPTHQGSGLSRRLLEAAEELLRAEGFAALEITVLSLRPELMPLYRKLGFVETGTEPFHSPQLVKDGLACHCICMSKMLRTPTL